MSSIIFTKKTWLSYLATLLCVVLSLIFIPASSGAENWIDFAADEFAGGDGTKKNPYQIESAEQLARLAKVVNEDISDLDGIKFREKSYKITRDIDLGARLWTPIGFNADNVDTMYIPFNGCFNGDGHSIFNMKVLNVFKSEKMTENLSSIDTGFFGSIGGGKENIYACIENLNLINIDVRGFYDTGGLAGSVGNGSTVAYCNVSGKVTGGIFHYYSAGGLVGENYGTIKKCTADVEIDVAGENVPIGGLAGKNQGTLSDCRAVSEIKASGHSHTVGGLIGINYGVIEGCEASVKFIKDIGWFISRGALAGENKGTVSGCRANGRMKKESGWWGWKIPFIGRDNR
jgi:hypothetical protein